MPDSERLTVNDLAGMEVLTLPEVAAYLRVPEEAVLELVAEDALPAQKIGGEWRFLKRAVAEWLRLGPRVYHDFRMFPPLWMPDHPFWASLSHTLEKRILSQLPTPESPAAKRGSPEAVLRHFGVFRDDADVDEQLASLLTQREAAGG